MAPSCSAFSPELSPCFSPEDEPSEDSASLLPESLLPASLLPESRDSSVLFSSEADLWSLPEPFSSDCSPEESESLAPSVLVPPCGPLFAPSCFSPESLPEPPDAVTWPRLSSSALASFSEEPSLGFSPSPLSPDSLPESSSARRVSESRSRSSARSRFVSASPASPSLSSSAFFPSGLPFSTPSLSASLSVPASGSGPTS